MSEARTDPSLSVWFISNGSGEDKIGAILAQTWRKYRPQDQLSALALVGTGKFYQEVGVELLLSPFAPPSAGFAYLNPLKLAGDFRAGLGSHLCRAWKLMTSCPADAVIAVGDIVPVLAAWRSGKPFAFIGCALSDYYTGGSRHTYDIFQRTGLKQAQLGIYPRDELTAQALQARGLPAQFLGNPMLDALDELHGYRHEVKTRPSGRKSVGLAPGSHDDALENFDLILTQLETSLTLPVDFHCALAPGLDAAEFEKALFRQGWRVQHGGIWYQSDASMAMSQGQWGKVLKQIDVLIGLAGTANEQAVGLGIPVISFSSQGLQYTARFAEAQTRLLGPALHWLEPCHPDILAYQLKRLLFDPSYGSLAKAQAQAVSAERFGSTGAALRIVSEIQSRLRGIEREVGFHQGQNRR